MILWLYERNCEYFHCFRKDYIKINYENLYFLASQIYDDASELQNPALLPLIYQLTSDMITWPEFIEYCDLRQFDIDDPNRMMINQISKETCRYIETIIKDALTEKSCTSKHLEILKKVHDENTLNIQGIATLAHDTHVERYLSNSGVKLADGFSPPVKGDALRIWRNHFSGEECVLFLNYMAPSIGKYFI